MPDPDFVRSHFAGLAPRYDPLNRLLSFGIDRGWRRRMLREAGDLRGRTAVDVCCGTGDVSLALAGAGASVVGVDFTAEMLVLAADKHEQARTRALHACGDALRLPLRDGAAGLATIAFGIRNVADRAAALREMRRVLAPGGHLLVLEFSWPPGRVFGALYGFYLSQILPRVGGLLSGDRELYEYLNRTVGEWPAPEAFAQEIARAGFVDCGFARLTRGIACLHWGRVPRS